MFVSRLRGLYNVLGMVYTADGLFEKAIEYKTQSTRTLARDWKQDVCWIAVMN